MRAGCEFSRVHTLLTLAIVEARAVAECGVVRKNARHAGAAWRMECA